MLNESANRLVEHNTVSLIPFFINSSIKGVRGVWVPPEKLPRSLAPKSSNNAIIICGLGGCLDLLVASAVASLFKSCADFP